MFMTSSVKKLDENKHTLVLSHLPLGYWDPHFSLKVIRFTESTPFTFWLFLYYTRKNAQVVTNVTNLQQTCSNAVPTTCQQDVFALLVPSLWTICYKVVELDRLVTSCSNNLLSSCNSTICQQVVSDNLVAT
jgi:hypothetical protein